MEILFHLLADLIDLHVASLIGHLGSDHDNLSP